MLYLQIESYQKSSSEHPVQMQLEQGAITIGRDPTNAWCLPDPGRVLSKQHCLIEKFQDRYKLTDTSTNGVFINGDTQPVGRDNSVILNSGDIIRLSDYEVSVKIEETQSAPESQFEPIQEPVQPVIQTPPPAPASVSFSEGDDWKAMLEGGAPAVQQDTSDPQVQRAVDVPDIAQSHYDAPSVGMSIPEDWGVQTDSIEQPIPEPVGMPSAEPANPIPEPPPMGGHSGPIPDNFMVQSGVTEQVPDFDDTPVQNTPPIVPETAPPQILQPSEQQAVSPPPAPAAVQPAPPVVPMQQEGMSAGTGQDLEAVAAFLKGAGLDPALASNLAPQQMMMEVGGLFRKVTMGLMGVLAARGDIKSEFRLSQTMIKPVENNPLKFSLNIDEAMVALLTKKGQGYMSADAAFDEAFEDLKGHQIAVLTGMQRALRSLLERLDPANIQGQEGEVSGVKKLLGGQKAQYWDDFVLLYKTLFQKTEDDFQTVFGHEFAKAYEEQIRKQKTKD